MKKTGIRIFVALLLTAVFLISSVMPTFAAPPQKYTSVEITEISGTYPTAKIFYTITWADDLGKATHFGVSITRYPTALPENKDTFFEIEIPIIETTTSPKSFITQHSYILPTYSYDVEVQLLVQKKNGTFRELKNTYSIDAGKPFGYD